MAQILRCTALFSIENFLNIQYWVHVDDHSEPRKIDSFLKNDPILKDARSRHRLGEGYEIGPFYPISEASRIGRLLEKEEFKVTDITQDKKNCK